MVLKPDLYLGGSQANFLSQLVSIGSRQVSLRLESLFQLRYLSLGEEYPSLSSVDSLMDWNLHGMVWHGMGRTVQHLKTRRSARNAGSLRKVWQETLLILREKVGNCGIELVAFQMNRNNSNNNNCVVWSMALVKLDVDSSWMKLQIVLINMCIKIISGTIEIIRNDDIVANKLRSLEFTIAIIEWFHRKWRLKFAKSSQVTSIKRHRELSSSQTFLECNICSK